MTDGVTIRVATPCDTSEILEIYAYYVKNTVITFEYDVPSVEEFSGRIAKTLKKYPYIVVEKGNKILGYAYTGAFVGRAAYDWSVETTVYVDHNAHKQGLGRMLYTGLENISRLQNIINLNACIGYPVKDDEYLTTNSADFHAHLGYRMVGEFHKCGYKFGRWYNMVWMEKMLSEHPSVPHAVIPFPKLSQESLAKIGISRR